MVVVQKATKVCIHPECGVTRELRHFKPKKAEVDGLSPLCDGCRYHMDTYKRLITRRGFSVTQCVPAQPQLHSFAEDCTELMKYEHSGTTQVIKK